MKMSCEFFVPGVVGKERPRVAGGRAYTPTKTKNYEESVAWAYKAAGGKMIEGAVSVSIGICKTPPKALSRAKRADLMGKPYLHRPDADNVLKAILDGLQGVAFADDAQVARVAAEKGYGEREGVIVYVEEL